MKKRVSFVVDVFYVTNAPGKNIQDGILCEQIQAAIQKAVNAFLGEEQRCVKTRRLSSPQFLAGIHLVRSLAGKAG